MTPSTQSSCLDALTEAASEVSATASGGLAFSALGATSSFGSEHGAYVGLVAQDQPIQVGLLVDAAGCQLLSKSLLGLEPSDEDLPPSDVSDALCEIINIVAGGFGEHEIEEAANGLEALERIGHAPTNKAHFF